MRIATQLVDGPLNQNMWADRFDRNLEDIFELQDQVTGEVVSALKVKLTNQEKEQRTNRSSVDPEACDLVKKARKTAAHIMQSEPDFSSEAFGNKLPFKYATMRSHFIDTLKEAGFP